MVQTAVKPESGSTRHLWMACVGLCLVLPLSTHARNLQWYFDDAIGAAPASMKTEPIEPGPAPVVVAVIDSDYCVDENWLKYLVPHFADEKIAVVQALEGFRRATNVLHDISFDTISGAGPNGAIMHYRVTAESNRAVGQDELLLVDSGALLVVVQADSAERHAAAHAAMTAADRAKAGRLVLHRAVHRDHQIKVEPVCRRHCGGRRDRHHRGRHPEREFPEHPQTFPPFGKASDEGLVMQI